MLKLTFPSRTVVVVLALLVASPCQAQDLAALARKEKERRAKVVKAVKVLTEDDAKEARVMGTGSVTALSGEGDAADPASAAGPGVGDEEARAGWKERADHAREAVVTAEKTLAQMEIDLGELRSDLAPLSAADAQDPMRLQKRDARIFAMNKQIEAQKSAIVEAKRALAAFEDEARRSGVPAGWLR